MADLHQAQGEAWESWCGPSTAEEFLQSYPGMNIEDAVSDYVATAKERWPHDEITYDVNGWDVHNLLSDYIRRNLSDHVTQEIRNHWTERYPDHDIAIEDAAVIDGQLVVEYRLYPNVNGVKPTSCKLTTSL